MPSPNTPRCASRGLAPTRNTRSICCRAPISRPRRSTTDYGYDGSGNQVSRTTNGTTTTNLWDTNSGLAQLVDDGSTSDVQANGAQGAIVSGNTTSYPLTDALGSVTGVTDSSGALTGTTSYDAFGAVRAQSGSSLSLGYTGQLTDSSTGFVDLRARQLDPTLGRFRSADTVQPNAPGTQGDNLYAYAANNPTTWVDLSGHDASAPTVEQIGGSSMTVTGPMVAAAAMQITYRSAALLTAAICSVRSCFAGTALLVFTVGVLICFLDLGRACWTQAVSTAGLFAQYGSAAVAGAWTAGVTATRDAAQTFPDLPTVDQPSTDPNSGKREVPAPPSTGNGDDEQCKEGAGIALYALDNSRGKLAKTSRNRKAICISTVRQPASQVAGVLMTVHGSN